MFFPEYTTEEWLTTHPELRILKTECLECGGEIKTTKPYVTPDYIGLAAFNCPDCGVQHRAFSSIPYSKSEIEAWSDSNGVLTF